MLRIDDLEAEIARLERQISEHRRGPGARSTRPTPATVGSDQTDSSGTT
jgi:hypothetical protein